MDSLDWHHRAACADQDPALWHPDKTSDQAVEARYYCHSRCPVRLECGTFALTQGERHSVAGGYRMWNKKDRALLEAELPGVVAPEVRAAQESIECAECGTEFTSTRSSTRCTRCVQGLTRSGPARAHLLALHAAGMSYVQIGALIGLAPNSVCAITSSARPQHWVRHSTAENILAISVPKQVHA